MTLYFIHRNLGVCAPNFPSVLVVDIAMTLKASHKRWPCWKLEEVVHDAISGSLCSVISGYVQDQLWVYLWIRTYQFSLFHNLIKSIVGFENSLPRNDLFTMIFGEEKMIMNSFSTRNMNCFKKNASSLLKNGVIGAMCGYWNPKSTWISANPGLKFHALVIQIFLLSLVFENWNS